MKISRIKSTKTHLVLTVLFCLLSLLFSYSIVSASSGSGNVSSIGGTGSVSTGSIILPPCLRTADSAQTADFECVKESIRYYTDLLLLVLGVASFVYFLYGAFLYTSAFGSEDKIKQAKKTITYALAGIVLATMAWVIVALLSQFLGVNAPS
jgi:hypothetical protein